MRQFFVKQKNQNTFLLESEDVHHCWKVLRLKPQDQLICVHQFQPYLCQIISINKNQVVCEIIDQIAVEQKKYEITLFFSIDKQKKWDLLVEKMCELGCDYLVPTIFSRSQKIYDLNYERLEKISYSAANQSNRFVPLKLLSECDFQKDIDQMLQNYDFVFYGDERFVKNAFQLKSNWENKFYKIAAIIGPSGGFDQKEFAFLEKKALALKLSNYILRSETAAITIINLIYFLLELK